jgi:nucleotide-binding universal stress UspA family protein
VFTRIVVGTDGSETAAGAVGKAIELAKLSGATLSIVSAYAPLSGRRVSGEQRQAPADVQYEIGPREDVNLILDAAAAEAKREGVEVQTHPVEADPADAILNVAEETKADHAPCSVIIVRTT